jgi:putative transposase
MPRTARQKSATGIYHVMLQGIDKRDIFNDDVDYLKFLSYVKRAQDKAEFNLYAYCLMPNHIHLLIKTEEEEIGRVMSKITVGYAQYFNYRFGRSGHLFQNRFKSEVVEDDSYFLTLVRYIHHNPVKAGLVKDSNDYIWSSYPLYLKQSRSCKENNNHPILDTEFVLGMFGDVNEFVTFMAQKSNQECMDVEERIRYTDEYLEKLLITMIGKKDLTTLSKVKKMEILMEIKKNTKATTRQLQRILKMGH